MADRRRLSTKRRKNVYTKEWKKIIWLHYDMLAAEHRER